MNTSMMDTYNLVSQSYFVLRPSGLTAFVVLESWPGVAWKSSKKHLGHLRIGEAAFCQSFNRVRSQILEIIQRQARHRHSSEFADADLVARLNNLTGRTRRLYG